MATWIDGGVADAWQATHDYGAGGDHVLGAGDEVWEFQSSTFPDTSGGSTPNWASPDEPDGPDTITDGSVIWRLVPAWQADSVVGDIYDTSGSGANSVQPTTPNQHWYYTDAFANALTGSSEPTWPTSGGSVDDGGDEGSGFGGGGGGGEEGPEGTVVVIEVHDGADPTGATVARFTDGQIGEGPVYRDAENELGAVGPFVIRRDAPDAELLVPGSYVKVIIAGVDHFGGWLDEGHDVLVGEGEEGTEFLVRGGPGILSILRHAALLDDLHAPAPPASEHRGNYDVPGKWTWEGEPFGAILTRLIEEGQNQPGTPLEPVTIDFDRTDDSNSDPWPEFTGIVEQDIGNDGLTVYGTLIDTGQLYVRAENDFSVHAYGSADYGVDRTGTAFGTGVVRFVKGVNILTEVDRTVGDSEGVRAAAALAIGRTGGRGTPTGTVPSVRVSTPVQPGSGRGQTHATHALVEGKDGRYRQVVSPLYATGNGRWTRVPYPESNDDDLLDSVGDEALQRGFLSREALIVEILGGNDEDNGRYTPKVHFDIGDTITLHTGDGATDYDNADARVTGITCILTDTSDDTDDETTQLSLRWLIELNGGIGRIGTTEGGGSVGCCGCTSGTQVPGTDPPAYYGEMYLGGHSEPGTDLQFIDGALTVPLAYVPSTAFWFSGTLSEGNFVPDGRAWPGVDVSPTAGLVDWPAPDGATAGRVYARVSCTDHVPEEET